MNERANDPRSIYEPPPPSDDQPPDSLTAPAALNRKGRDFLRTLRIWRGAPTPKQMAWLIRIYESVS